MSKQSKIYWKYRDVYANSTEEAEATKEAIEKVIYEIEVPESVRWFAQQMEKKLQKNDHKGGWEDLSLDILLDMLKIEVMELEASIKEWQVSRDIIEESADVANFAMMIADIARKE